MACWPRDPNWTALAEIIFVCGFLFSLLFSQAYRCPHYNIRLLYLMLIFKYSYRSASWWLIFAHQTFRSFAVWRQPVLNFCNYQTVFRITVGSCRISSISECSGSVLFRRQLILLS
jgi:hypothetical protein